MVCPIPACRFAADAVATAEHFIEGHGFTPDDALYLAISILLKQVTVLGVDWLGKWVVHREHTNALRKATEKP